MSKKIYLAGGCFWGVAEYYSRVPGVSSAVCGYTNGSVENPSYEQVCTGKTGHAETVCVSYNPEIIGLRTLIEQLFKIINPLSVNQQGNDFGTQYRTGMYYVETDDLATIQAVFDREQEEFERD